MFKNSKSLALQLSFLLCLVPFACAQTSSVSSTDWEFRQIGQSMVERENRVRQLIVDILPKVDALIAELKPNAALKLTNDALQNLKDYLTSLVTLADYGAENATLTCDNVAMRMASIRFDIEKCVKIRVSVAINSTLLFAKAASLNVGYVANYFSLTDAQRRSVQSIITSTVIIVDEYNAYTLTLAMAIYKYTRIYIELLFCKKTYCNCPTQLNSISTAALVTVDAALIQIQTSVDSREANIRKISTELVPKIDAINPILKTTPQYIFITTTLDSIATLVKGYQQLTTTDVINSTTSCDDAAMKVAFIEYKFELYFQANVEAAKNATWILFYMSNLNAFYYANFYNISPGQQNAIDDILATMRSLIEAFTQYILTLSISLIKLFIQLWDARLARYGSCNCTETSNGASTTMQLTTTSAKPLTSSSIVTTTIMMPTTSLTLLTATTTTPETTTTTPTTTTTTPTTTTTTPTTTTTTPTTTTTTPTTTTTTPETTTMSVETTPAVPKDCGNPASDTLYQSDVLNADGTYMKKLCAIALGDLNYDAAFLYCKNNGMTMFVVDSAQTQSELYRINLAYLGPSPNALFVDGKYDVVDGKYYYYGTGTKTPSYAGLDLKTTPSTTNQGLVTSSDSDGFGFHMDGRAFPETLWFICEA